MTVRARVISGRLVVDEPTDLPEGTEIDLAEIEHAEDPAIARAWAEEIDRRAERALRGVAGVCRAELAALERMPTAEAHARLEQRVNSRK